MALASTQRLTEMSTRSLPGDKGRPTHKADITAICEPIFQGRCGQLLSIRGIGLNIRYYIKFDYIFFKNFPRAVQNYITGRGQAKVKKSYLKRLGIFMENYH
jgi:hypothetical protein